jgi:hypothetical protein
VLARVTHAASVELALRPGMPVWVLVKAVSIRDHAFANARAGASREAGEMSRSLHDSMQLGKKISSS